MMQAALDRQSTVPDAPSMDALAASGGVSIRRIPYPYRAMLAICSDLDQTPDRQVFLETMRFLNTTQNTCMGPGVGLEVGNTIYFDMPPGQFAYWNTDDVGRAMARELIRSGHIDCLHSFGDLATTRAHAGRALDELSRHGCRLEVWIDHAVAPSNFGPDIMGGLGDVPGTAVYHADLTCGYGIQYVWRGRVTSVIGQDAPRSLRGIARVRHPLGSARTAAKELVKGILARRGNAKYAMHGPNRILRDVRLRSGHGVREFLRANPCWAGVDRAATADGLAEVLTPRMLARLVARESPCILYTHLGKIRRRDEPFGPRTRQALRLLARCAREREILVTTTRRLLGYCRAVRAVALAAADEGNGQQIEVTVREHGGNHGLAMEELAGLTLYVSNPATARVRIGGHEVMDLRRNAPDGSGRGSVSLPWRPLELPTL
jgi:hypothetical protein